MRNILSFSAAVSEAFASDFVLNSVWDSRRLRFRAFVPARLTAFLEGRARRAPAGVLPCARLRVSRHRRARRPRTRKTFCWGEETRRFYFIRSWRFVSLLLREELLVTAPIIVFFVLSQVSSLGLADATALYRMPCFAGGHRPRPVRTLRSCLTRWLPSLAPLCSPDNYARLLEVSRRSWYQDVAYPGDCLVGVL